MNEMTAEQAAEILEIQAKTYPCLNCWPAFNMGASVLRRVASGELAEVKHAHWIKLPIGTTKGKHTVQIFACSNCKTPMYDSAELRHCPNCGALMDGEEDSHV